MNGAKKLGNKEDRWILSYEVRRGEKKMQHEGHGPPLEHPQCVHREQKSHNAQPVSQSTPVVTGSLIDRLRAGTVFGGMGTTDTQTTMQVPLASNASSTPDAEHRKFQEYCCALLNSSPCTRDGDVDKQRALYTTNQ